MLNEKIKPELQRENKAGNLVCVGLGLICSEILIYV